MLDEEGRPSFQRLQRRAQQRRTTDVQRAALEMPATYFAFDLLAFEGFDLRPLPLVERKALLQSLLPRAGPVRFLDHVPEQGEAFYAEVSRLRLEGLIAKRADAPYRPGRSPHWLKLRTERVDDFVVVGFTQPRARAPASARCTSPPSRASRSSTAAGPAAASAKSSSSPCAKRSTPCGGTRPPAAARCRPTGATCGSSRGSSPRCAT